MFVKDGGVINFPIEKSHPRAGKLGPGCFIQYQLGLLYLDALYAMRGGTTTGIVQSPVGPQQKLLKHGESLDDPHWTLDDRD